MEMGDILLKKMTLGPWRSEIPYSFLRKLTKRQKLSQTLSVPKKILSSLKPAMVGSLQNTALISETEFIVFYCFLLFLRK